MDCQNSSDYRQIGPRVVLDLLQPRHAEELYDYKRRNRTFLKPFSPPQSEEQFTLEAQQAAIAQALEDAAADRSYRFGIFHGESGRLIGQVNLTGIIRGPFQNALLGYSMDERHNGKGLMTEAVGLCAKFAFETLKLHRIQAAVMPHNTGSIRVLEKNGFSREGYSRRYLFINGQWEDHVLYALLSDDDAIQQSARTEII
jgi:ribosomal-protein-alanine N-acetyltransferase